MTDGASSLVIHRTLADAMINFSFWFVGIVIILSFLAPLPLVLLSPSIFVVPNRNRQAVVEWSPSH